MEYIDNMQSMDRMRSEKMMFAQLIIPVESAHRAVSYLGHLGLLQFKDVRLAEHEHDHELIEMITKLSTATNIK